MSDYAEFEIAAILNNVMIIDQLFKANGNIHKICSHLQTENERYHEESVTGLDVVRDSDDYSFMIYAKDFRFRIKENMISIFYGEFGINVNTRTGDSIENFKLLFLTLVNIHSDQKFENVEQFVDLYNMIHI